MCSSLRYLGPDFGNEDNASTEAIAYTQLPSLARQSFPLCMLVSHRQLLLPSVQSQIFIELPCELLLLVLY